LLVQVMEVYQDMLRTSCELSSLTATTYGC
jgi:hypothetical protein